MKNLDKIKKEIEKIVKKSPLSNDSRHSKYTLKCLLRLKPDADEVLQIAALAHDIERGGNKKWANIPKKDLDITAKKYKRPHEEGGAKIIGEILRKHGIERNFIKKVKKIVARHEEGGDEDTNLIKDADSLSFFEKDIFDFLNRANTFDEGMAKKKIDWMYNRITSNEVKKMVRNSYKKAIKDLK